MREREPDLLVQLTRNIGSYSIEVGFDSQKDLALVAVLNPALPYSVIVTQALEDLKRWELVEARTDREFRLTNMLVQRQKIADFDVRVWPMQRAPKWDLLVGGNFFDAYTEFRLHLATNFATLTH